MDPLSEEGKEETFGLNTQQLLFCQEYFIDFNASQAAIRAGYSAKCAKVVASKIMRKPAVKAYIEQRKQRLDKMLEDKYLVSKDSMLGTLARIALADIRTLFNENGSMKAITDLEKDETYILSGMDVYEEFENAGESKVHVGQTKKVKLTDRIKAIAEINKMMGYYEPIKTDHTTKGESMNKGFFHFIQKVNQVKEE